jgi:ribonucleoside-diphosphate reductase alpha chain
MTMTMVSRDTAYAACLSEMKNPLAAKVTTDKYLLCDEHGSYVEKTLKEMWSRLAIADAAVEKEGERTKWAETFACTLSDFKFVPAGRVLYGLGNRFVTVTLKNCYVLGIKEDSIKGIFDLAYWMAETYKAGGGTGTDLSPLRPKGSPIRNAARISTGAPSFADFFSHITGMIGQKARIGALLLCIDISHPDVEDFISMKGDDLNKVRYANISVKITDEFMKAVEKDENFDLCWGGKTYRTVKARDLWNKVVHYAWKRAEPGILFWDKICKELPAHNYAGFETIATNPCGEATLSHGDSCNLGSMNFGRYVRNSFTKGATFDFESFDKDVRVGVRFLDNIISLEKTPLDFQQWANDNGRRLGLGIMGLADTFLKMGIRYDSDEALELTDKIMNNFMLSSYDASCDLAIEKGPFPIFDVDTHFKSDFINRLPEWLKAKIRKTGIRNISIHAIAPTGSLSCIAQCSSGIEPVYRMRHIRKTNLGTAKEVETHVVTHSVAEEYLKFQAEQITKAHGKQQDSADQPLPDYFVSAHEISPERRITLQATIQKYIDQSISNTVNLPKSATEEEIGKYYMDAWKKGLKGITVYREGSREGVLTAIDEKEKDERGDEIRVQQAPKRPNELKGRVHIIKPNGKRYTIFVGLMGERVYEVFALEHKQAGVGDEMEGIIKKTKSTDADGNIYSFESGLLTVRHLNRYEDQEASLITRLISTALRHGTPLEFIIHQINCSKISMSSFAKAICRALSLYIKEEDTKGKFKCPSCGSKNVRFHGMCYTCEDCASSRCQ